MDQEPLLALLALLGMLVAVAFGLMIVGASIWLMIAPVEGRARATGGRFRFRLIDLACLLIQWQVILAIISGFHRDNWESLLAALAFVGIPACGVVAFFWSTCVSVLSRANIHSSARRAAFILLSVPGAIAAILSLAISGALSVVSVIQPFEVPSDGRGLTSAIVFLATCVGIVLLRLLSLWIAADAKSG